MIFSTYYLYRFFLIKCQKRLANAALSPARRGQKQLITGIWWLFISSSCPPWTLNRAHSLMNWLWSKTLNPQIQLLWKPNIKQTSNDRHLQERHATFSTFIGQNYHGHDVRFQSFPVLCHQGTAWPRPVSTPLFFHRHWWHNCGWWRCSWDDVLEASATAVEPRDTWNHEPLANMAGLPSKVGYCWGVPSFPRFSIWASWKNVVWNA